MSKIIFIQSFSAPKGTMEKSKIFKAINGKFKNVLLLSIDTDSVKNLTVFQTLYLAFKSILFAKKGDIIFGWGADVCFYSCFLNLFFRKDVKFFSQNMIIDVNRANRFRVLLYKYAMRNSRFYSSVNAPGLKSYYSSILKCKEDKMFLVYDCMELKDADNSKNIVKKEYDVFFGGKAFRDIDTFIQIVKLLPTYSFVAVVKKEMLRPEMYELKNLRIFYDVEYSKFYELLEKSSLCCIPLISKVPCGLFVMQHAALFGVPIISTETPSMRTIVPSDDYGYLFPIGDAQNMATKISTLMNDGDLYYYCSSNAKDNMKKFSSENVSLQLCDALSSL